MRMLRMALQTSMEQELAFDPWVGFDLDGTLAVKGEWKGIEHIGEPIPAMVKCLQNHLADGDKVKIFTARVAGDDADAARGHIEAYCLKHIGQVLEITNEKDPGMIKLYDDLAVQVVENTGVIVGE